MNAAVSKHSARFTSESLISDRGLWEAVGGREGFVRATVMLDDKSSVSAVESRIGRRNSLATTLSRLELARMDLELPKDAVTVEYLQSDNSVTAHDSSPATVKGIIFTLDERVLNAARNELKEKVPAAQQQWAMA